MTPSSDLPEQSDPAGALSGLVRADDEEFSPLAWGEQDVRLVAVNVCECGHPASDHALGYICTHWLGEGPDAWYGVCPCIRTDEDGNDAPLSELRARSTA